MEQAFSAEYLEWLNSTEVTISDCWGTSDECNTWPGVTTENGDVYSDALDTVTDKRASFESLPYCSRSCWKSGWVVVRKAIYSNEMYTMPLSISESGVANFDLNVNSISKYGNKVKIS